HVSSLTGQPFNPDFFARDGFVYDTEPACRAVVSVRALQPEISLMYFGMLQQAFYAEGRDITRNDELAACASAIGLAPSVFESFFASEKAIPATQRDFQIKQRLGVTSLPTLVTGSDGEDPVVIADGYRDLAPLFPAIERWIGSA
ncbi:MAG: DsbA family protein, partial [Pseudomonadota bacterium]